MFSSILAAIRQEIANESLSVTAMAKRLGISQPSLHRILRGEQQMGVAVLATILDARPDWRVLLNGDGPGSPCNH